MFEYVTALHLCFRVVKICNAKFVEVLIQETGFLSDEETSSLMSCEYYKLSEGTADTVAEGNIITLNWSD